MSDAALPSGIVTFVLTDIEGSTKLLRRLGDGYPEVLERHLTVMRDAWARHGGCEMDSVGDSVLVAFGEASAALLACADAQRSLASAPWPPGGQVRVRMGVHSGLAAPRDGRYVALTVHQGARVMSAAHGGQILVSSDTVALLSATHEIAMVPLGRYRLRDFDEPVQLFQVAAHDPDHRFPGVRALPADGHNLVAPPTSFVGRDDEIDDVVDALAPGRLVTLTGPGGVGKTRLAVEAGRRSVPTWPEGVWFVDLTTLDDPAQLVSAIGDACGAPSPGGDRWAEVTDHLRDRTALLILDNCEHLGSAVGVAVTRLLGDARSVAVLATSREPLATAGESIRRVGTLAVPGQEAGRDEVAGAASVALFLDRARAVRADFTLDADTAPVVAEICRRLDGLPLALELAAARLSELTPADVLRGLQDRFRLLRSRHATVLERQRTMEGVLEWSYRLLDAATQTCFRRLGVFGGSFSLDAAIAAAQEEAIDGDQVPDLVWSLVDRSLVAADLTANHTRYRLLESVRAFALHRLEESQEVEATATRLARWYLERVGVAHRHRRSWPGDVAVELDNLRALVPLVARADGEQAQELATAIVRYLGLWQSSHAGIDEARHQLRDLPDATPTRVALLSARAECHLAAGEVDEAKRALHEAQALFAIVGELPWWDDAALTRTHAELCTRSGDMSTAIDIARQALATNLSIQAQGSLWCRLGIAAGELGDLDTAADAFEHELAAWTELGDEWLQASAAGNIAEAALQRGDVGQAAAHQLQCLDLAFQLGATVNVAFSLIVAARIAGDDEPERATMLHALAETMLDRSGFSLFEGEARASERMLAAARGALGDAAYARARREGVALDIATGAALAERVLRAAAR